MDGPEGGMGRSAGCKPPPPEASHLTARYTISCLVYLLEAWRIGQSRVGDRPSLMCRFKSMGQALEGFSLDLK